jgi:hypothetical protein
VNKSYSPNFYPWKLTTYAKIPRVPRDKLVICGSMVSDAKRELTRGSVFLS